MSYDERLRLRAVKLSKKRKHTDAEPTPMEAPPPPPPPPVVKKRDGNHLFTQEYRPNRVVDIVGNTRAKYEVVNWLKQGVNRGGVCLLSGPVGCGKTSLSRAALKDYGCDVIDLRAEGVNLEADLTDLMGTKPQEKALGVVIDEVENMTNEKRKLLVSLLTKRVSLVPIICICEDAGAKAVQTVVKACRTRVRMVTPTKQDAALLVERVSPELTATQKSHVVDSCNGDLRQATIMCQEMCRSLVCSGKDLHPHNIFDATTQAMSTRDLDTAETCVKYDGIMPFMVHDNLILPSQSTARPPKRTKETIEASLQELLRLEARLDLLGASDLMGSHPAHQTHAYSDVVCAGGVIHSRAPNFRASFPTKHLGLGAGRRRMRADLEQVVTAPTTTTTRPDSYFHTYLKMLLKKGVDRQDNIKKDVVKRFQNSIA